MPERFKVVCIPCKALYKCSDLPFTSTSPDPVSDSMHLELKRDRRKGMRKGIEAGADKTNVHGGPYRSIGTGGLTRACDGSGYGIIIISDYSQDCVFCGENIVLCLGLDSAYSVCQSFVIKKAM